MYDLYEEDINYEGITVFDLDNIDNGIALEHSSEVSITNGMRIETIKKKLLAYDLTNEILEEHVWKYHGIKTEDRKPLTSDLQSWFFGDLDWTREHIMEAKRRCADDLATLIVLWLKNSNATETIVKETKLSSDKFILGYRKNTTTKK